MNLRQVTRQTLTKLRALPLKIVLPAGVGMFALTFYILAFIVEKPVLFSYSGQNCVQQLTMLPNIHKQVEGQGFSVSYHDQWTLGETSLLATKTCFTPTAMPREGVNKVISAPFGGLLARNTYSVIVESPPVANVTIFNSPIAIGRELKLPLSTPDKIYDYTLVVNQKETVCEPHSGGVSCDLDPLGLEQDKTYKLSLQREWSGKRVETLSSKQVKTLPATNIVKAAVNEGQTVYERPISLEFEFDKPIVSLNATLKKLEGDKEVAVTTTKTIKDKKLTLALTKELDRNAKYSLSIDELEAKDGSTLVKPYSANFTMSGGPKIISQNIGATRAGLSQSVVLTFDQPLSKTQDITKLVGMVGIAGVVSRTDTQIIITYSNATRCQDFRITIAGGLESAHGIVQTEAQVISSRTVCHIVETIGYSTKGRAINAYFFGTGAKRILFTGAIHGNEKSTKYTLDSWIDDLESQARNIPTDKQIVIVPIVNPDGFYQYGRLNANGVNLNRNWPTYNWAKDAETSPGKVEAGIGGPSPLSERETQVLAALTNRLGPAFVATYHSQGNIVNSNDVGLSVTLGQRYASQTGYKFVADSQTTETFGVPVTGTYEDWLKERGIPAILMELNTNTGNHFSQNKAAMWMLVNGF